MRSAGSSHGPDLGCGVGGTERHRLHSEQQEFGCVSVISLRIPCLVFRSEGAWGGEDALFPAGSWGLGLCPPLATGLGTPERPGFLFLFLFFYFVFFFPSDRRTQSRRLAKQEPIHGPSLTTSPSPARSPFYFQFAERRIKVYSEGCRGRGAAGGAFQSCASRHPCFGAGQVTRAQPREDSRPCTRGPHGTEQKPTPG